MRDRLAIALCSSRPIGVKPFNFVHGPTYLRLQRRSPYFSSSSSSTFHQSTTPTLPAQISHETTLFEPPCQSPIHTSTMARQRRSAAPARSAPTRPTAAPARPAAPQMQQQRPSSTAAAPVQTQQAPAQSSGGSSLFGQMAATAG